MVYFLKTKAGRLRLLGYLEGLSLLILVFVAIPMKYLWNNPSLSKFLGPVHGALFILFLLNTIIMGIEQNWKFRTTWKIILACFIPFGTFYADRIILKNIRN